MTTIHERIRSRRKIAGMTQADLAKKVGVARVSLTQWEIGATSPKGENLMALSRALGCSPQWLSDGREDAEIQPLKTWEAGEEDDQTLDLPYFREVQFAAGNGRTTAVEQGAGSLRFSRSILRDAGVDADHAACATNSGDSMADKILDGAGIGIDRSKLQIKDGKIYAIDHDGLLRVKYLHRLPGGGIKLRSHNKDGYPDEDYPADYAAAHIRILGWVFWWSSVDRW